MIPARSFMKLRDKENPRIVNCLNAKKDLENWPPRQFSVRDLMRKIESKRKKSQTVKSNL